MSKVTKERAQKLFNEVLNNMVNSNLFNIPLDIIDKELYFNRRTSSLGMCESYKINGEYYNHKIFLSTYAMDDEETIKDVLAHEICHTMPNCKGHNKEFKRNANLCKDIGYNVNVRATSEQSIKSGIREAKIQKSKLRKVEEYKYKIKCPCCNGYRLYKRKNKIVENPSNYLCGKCNVRLVME